MNVTVEGNVSQATIETPTDEVQVEGSGPRFGVAWAAVMRDPNITPVDKGWWATLATWAGETGAWPSVGTLAQAMGASRRTAQRALRRLEELGLVEALTDKTGGSGNTVRYRLVGPEWAQTEGRHERRPSRKKGVVDVQKRATPTTPEQTSRTNHLSTRARAREILDLFNEAFGTRWTSMEFESRIERNWPKGWTAAEWAQAIEGMRRRPEKDQYWLPDKPTPFHLVGRRGGELETNYARGGGDPPGDAPDSPPQWKKDLHRVQVQLGQRRPEDAA